MLKVKYHLFGRLWKAFCCSTAGIKATFIHEQAFRQELLVLVFVLPMGLLLGEIPKR